MKRILLLMCVSAAFLILILIGGCRAAPDVSVEKDGRRYGVTRVPFKGQWWHYYERGLSFADGGFWARAESDLREAIRRRRDDKTHARTYGRHFLDLPDHDPGYFAHRELGIVLYRQGRIDAAIRELTESLSSETSARAQLYLDRARKKKIEREGSDRRPPDIAVRNPLPGAWTNGSEIVVRGAVRDDTFVREVRVGGKRVRIDLSRPEIVFRETVRLVHGENRIPIVASDLSGRSATVHLTLHVDRIGPVISAEGAADDRGESGSDNPVIGYAFDNSGIAEIAVNGVKTRCDGERERAIRVDRPYPTAGADHQVRVTDLAGNVTTMAIPWRRPTPTAGANWLAASGDSNLAFLLASSTDMTPPTIRLSRFKDEQKPYIAYLDEALVEGTIRDNQTVKDLYFNRERIVFRGKKNAFTYIHPLQKGDNLIVIRGVDAAGNEARRMIRIIHKEPLVRDYRSRLQVALEEFKEKPEGLDLSFDVQQALDSVMFDRKRFQVVTDIEIEGLENADSILRGIIRKRLNYIEIYANLYLLAADPDDRPRRLAKVDSHREAESGTEEIVVDRPLIEEIARELHLKLADEIPLIEGRVTANREGKIATDLGEETHVKEGMGVIVFEKNEDELDKDFERLGDAEIDEVETDQSFARVREGNIERIGEGDHVITR